MPSVSPVVLDAAASCDARGPQLLLDIDTINYDHVLSGAVKKLFLDGREMHFVTRWNKAEGWMDVYDPQEPTFALRFKRHYGEVTYILQTKEDVTA